MKKVLLIAVAALAFAACGNKGAEENTEAVDSTAVEVATAVDSTAATADSTAKAAVDTVAAAAKTAKAPVK
ncbi:MAG TPA: lipoprotein [Candidatus Egerieousia sp.]|nr:lipoprotein [Candidatus Egerieousia sp.]HPT05346.1 lipoprotein [Candidatus Egerieousia sp.]